MAKQKLKVAMSDSMNPQTNAKDFAAREIIDDTAGCSGLTSVTIPNSVTSIGSWAFNKCDALKQIIIPVNSRKKFEDLLPEYKNILVEIEI